MNAKKQIVLVSGIFIAISLILIFVFVLPLSADIRKDSLELVSIKKELVTIYEKTEGMGDIKKTCDTIDYDLEKSKDLFVNLEVPVKLMEFLENNANDLGLLVKTSPIFLKEAKDDLWDFVGFRLAITGSYDNLMRFIERTESAPFLIEEQDLSIGILTNGDISASLTIKVFGK